MLMGLKENQEKMSKSDPDSAIFMEDTAVSVLCVLVCACVCAWMCAWMCAWVCFAWMYGVRVHWYTCVSLISAFGAAQHMYASKSDNVALAMFIIKCITSVARAADGFCPR